MRREVRNIILAIMLSFIVFVPCVFTIIETPFMLSASATIPKVDYHFVITGSPSSITAGQSFSGVTVTVYRNDGHIKTDYHGRVYFCSTDSQATLPYSSLNSYKYTTNSRGDRGIHTFSGFNLKTQGSQTITVTDGKTSTTTTIINVSPSTPTSIQISPKTSIVTAGLNQAFTAKATDYYGNSWDVTTLTSWSIATGAYGSWSGNVYTSAQSGSWSVTGAYAGLHDTALITVNHDSLTRISINPKNAVGTAGVPTAFYTTAFDSFGNTWDVSSLTTWTIDSGANGFWSANNCTCTKAGVWTITGSFSGLSDTTTFNVTHASPMNIAFFPSNPTSSAGSSIMFTNTAFDAYGNSWIVTDSTVWSIEQGAGGYWTDNTYHCSKAGTWKVTGVFGTITNTTVLTVGYTTVFTITVSPKTISTLSNTVTTFTATASDIYGNIWDVSTSATWSIDPNAGGTWLSNTYTSAMAGDWIVKAVYRGMSDTASLTVVHGSPIRIVVGSYASSALAGSNVPLTATAFDSLGNPWDISSSTFWSINPEANGSWSQNTYTCAKIGSWTITGTYQGLSATSSLLVTPSSPVSVTTSFSDSTVVAGASQTFMAIAIDSYNNSWDVSSSVSWSISNGAGGSWTNNVYTTAHAGTWTVTANLGSMTTTSILIVNHGTATQIIADAKTVSIIAGLPQAFTAMAVDSLGNSWNITDSLTISPDPQSEGSLSGNYFTCFKEGNWTITVRTQNLFDTVLLTVTHSAPVSITVTSTLNSIVAGSSQLFISTASDTYDNLWDVTDNTNWNISIGAGGSWNGNVYTSEAAGNWVIAGEYAGLSDYIYLTVNHAVATRIKISPNIASVIAGSSEAFSATASDVYNNSWDVSNSVSWSIESGAGGLWNENVYTSDNAGTWAVNASIGSLFANATITVNHGTGFSLVINPSSPSVTAGSSQTFTALASDLYGNYWDVTSDTAWCIDSASGGNWLGNTCTSSAAGKWAITGTFSGLSSTSSLTVNHGAAVNMTINSVSSSIIAGTSIACIATACDAYGNTWDVTGLTSWAINSDAGGSWSGNVFTSEFSGVWCINGTLDSLTKSSYITVNHASPVSISINSFVASIPAGSSEAYTAIAVDAFSNSWDVTALTVWSIDSGAGGSWQSNVYSSQKEGIWNVTANFNSLIAISSVIVTHASPRMLMITPNIQSIQSGSSQSFAATATDAFGNSWDTTSSSSWTIDTKAGGFWSGNTYFSSKAGSWVVTVEVSGVIGTTYLTVDHGVIQEISITPQSASLALGDNQIFIAMALDASGNSWDVTNSVNWAVNPSSGGNWVSNNFTPKTAGDWTINALLEGTTGATTITITNSNQTNALDLNQDGAVNFQDIAYFIQSYISFGENGISNSICDLNNDGKVDFQDLVTYISAYIGYVQTP